MKKILLFVFVVAGLSACSPHMYNTYSAGKDNASFIIVLTNGQHYENVSVSVDGQTFPIEKVYKVKATRKAIPVTVTPGKHQIKVISNGKTLVEENIFLGLQETKKIVLK
jgi:hypothetical protein